MKEQLEKIIPTREDFEQWVKEEKDKETNPYLVRPLNYKEARTAQSHENVLTVSVWGLYMSDPAKELRKLDVDPESILFEVMITFGPGFPISAAGMKKLLKGPDSERYSISHSKSWGANVFILAPSKAHNSKDVWEKTTKVIAEDEYLKSRYGGMLKGFPIYVRNVIRVIAEPILDSESLIDESQLQTPTTNSCVSL